MDDIYLSEAEWTEFMAQLDNPPQPNENLVDLFKEDIRDEEDER